MSYPKRVYIFSDFNFESQLIVKNKQKSNLKMLF